MKYKAILFGSIGTLIESSNIQRNSFNEAFKEAGLDWYWDEQDYKILLKTFWEAHNPTQGMRQGNDIGTQYRSAIFTHSSEQKKLADESMKIFSSQLKDHGFSNITTEISEANEFFYAEDYHQQYLAKNPNGYCGLGGTGISCSLD